MRGKKCAMLRNSCYRGVDTTVGQGALILQDTYIGDRWVIDRLIFIFMKAFYVTDGWPSLSCDLNN